MVESRRAVGLPPLVERPETPTRVQDTAAATLWVWLVRPVWLWRRELALVLPVPVVVAVAAGLWWWTDSATTALTVAGYGLGGWALLGGVLLGVAPVRRRVRRWLSSGQIRRRWDGACRFAGLQTPSLRVPRVLDIARYPAGERLRVRLPKGTATTDLEAAAERVAVVLDVREVRVRRDPKAARYPRVEIARRDPFADADGLPLRVGSVLAEAASWCLWDPIPVGLDAMGAPVELRLPGRNLLLGGEPEAGKSVAQSQVLAAAALDATVTIYGLDAKQVELALWAPVLARVVYTDIDEAIDLLTGLVARMDETYAQLWVEGRRGVSRDLGWPLTLLAIDELRFYTNHGDRKKRDEFNRLLIDLVARGRAAGVIVAAATQRPSSDVVPTSLRDLFAYRWAMRCSTKAASDTILGQGWATEGYSASTIDVADRGVGYLIAEGGEGLPVQLKSAFLDDAHVAGVVQRAARARVGGPG